MLGMIAAANCVPNFAYRQDLKAEDLRRLQEPACIFEAEHTDSDGVVAYIYTVAGWLDGRNVATLQGGCTVAGETMLIHADSREHADLLAGLGLQDTIDALNAEEARYIDAHAALARLHQINDVRRLEVAAKPDSDKSDDFEQDMAKVRPLVGDDIILTVGHVEH